MGARTYLRLGTVVRDLGQHPGLSKDGWQRCRGCTTTHIGDMQRGL